MMYKNNDSAALRERDRELTEDIYGCMDDDEVDVGDMIDMEYTAWRDE